MTLDWYFDYVSPYAYLQLASHPDLFGRPDVVFRPVVFAGLLKHWGHLGPAEIPSKKRHMFRLLAWQSVERGVAMRAPPAHPFNPIPVLRLTLALGATYAVVKTIYEFVWKEGRSVDDDWATLCMRLGVSDGQALIVAQPVKDALRANGERALAAGVFGVPTFVVDDELFWGEDATGLLRAYLADPRLFDTPAMHRIDTLPVAAERRR